MAYLILKIMINAISITVAVKLINDITFTGEWWKMIIIGAVFGIVNSFIRPIVKFFAFPFIILTLGLFTFIINALMLLLTETLSDYFNLGLQIHGFLPALWGALIVSIVSTILSWLTGLREIKYHKNL
ncbi:MAG: phage holin family protein [Thermodesulfovibrionales bacterium]